MKRNKQEEFEVKATLQPARIEFLCQLEKPVRTLDDLNTHSLASVRLRTAIAAYAVKELNWEISFSDGKVNKATDILVVGKVHPDLTDKWLTRIQKVKTYGGKIVIDYTDNHVESQKPIGEFYRKAIINANIVVCSSYMLQKYIAKYFDVKTLVIEEPIEVPIIKPTIKKNDLTTILWFGHTSNLNYLIQCLHENFLTSNKARLILMTNECPLPENYVQLLEVDGLENIEIHVIPWTKKDMIKAAEMSDFCIIPTGYKDERKKGASSNRLLTSLAMGLPTLTDELDAYKPFEKYFKKLSRQTMQDMIAAPLVDDILINEIQQIITQKFTIQAIKKEWASVLLDLNKLILLKEKSFDAVKLNLGCGDKIIDGYINVDVVIVRAGKKPDVICDLHNLRVFESNSVDEILAVHVVEHFWQWEVVDILKEWVRVLKPGGKMILECPNLISAAEEFLKNPDIAAIGAKEGQRSMWVFYGDPAWKDPLMIHRWGYTPRSLATVMSYAGLCDLKQEPAQFKLREPRDMRITGTKPLI